MWDIHGISSQLIKNNRMAYLWTFFLYNNTRDILLFERQMNAIPARARITDQLIFIILLFFRVR